MALGAAALLLLGQPAAAFYWYGWPGSGVTPPATITPRANPELPVGETTPPTVTKEPPDVPTDPKQIPEPGTLLATAIGLGAVGLVRRWRRGRTPT